MPNRALTPKHLLVLQATLLFWQDEMRPHDPELLAAYVGEPVTDVELPDEDDVTWIADNFDRFRLRYVATSLDGSRLLYDRLYAEPEAAEQALGTSEGRVGTLLILMDEEA